MDTIINQMFEITIKKIFEFCVNTIQSLIDLFTDLSDTLFQSAYVQGLLSFFQYFGYCLFIIACIIGIFEMVIQYQNGDGSAARSLFMNFIKGLMAALLFTTLPVLLFQFVLELQKYITVALTGSMDLDGQMLNAIEQIGIILNGGELPPGSETGAAGVTIPAGQMAITLLIVVILLVYVSIKVVFGNIKRGGILLIITCIGSFHMFNVPRGYFDAFFWLVQTGNRPLLHGVFPKYLICFGDSVNGRHRIFTGIRPSSGRRRGAKNCTAIWFGYVRKRKYYGSRSYGEHGKTHFYKG